MRGRIGRSDKKAYCYFLIPETPLGPEAAKRLQALQIYTELGSGFNLANSDLEIRGSGDILGAGQSGHMASVGPELYMELLQKAIDEIKGKKTMTNRDIEIRTPFSALIPEQYITDSSLRLKYYKKLANATSIRDLEILEGEIKDIFGHPPEECMNLFKILRIKKYLSSLAIGRLEVWNAGWP